MKLLHRIDTWLGSLLLVADSEALLVCAWQSALEAHKYEQLNDASEISHPNDILLEAERQIVEYLSGERREFTIPLRIYGSRFRCEVWSELGNISYGETVTYGEIAKRLGCPGACRSVGHAIAMNPLSIFIPCHRVVPAHGKTYGNYAGGRCVKSALIDIERKSR